MKKFLSIVSVSLLGLLTITALAFSQHGHGGGAGNPQPAMKMDSTDILADGTQVTFMVMRNTTHKGMLEKMKMKEELEPGSTRWQLCSRSVAKTGSWAFLSRSHPDLVGREASMGFDRISGKPEERCLQYNL
jgi:hypothetical protein